MKKLSKAAILVAFVATFGWATSALGASISIVGADTPGTNVYEIVLSYTAGEGVDSYATSLETTGTVSGTADVSCGGGAGGGCTNTLAPGFLFLLPFNNPPAPGSTGVSGSWAGSGFAPGPGGSVTIGTLEITVAAGDVVNPFFTINDGLAGGGASIPADLNGITIVPEPATAGMMVLGLLGLGFAGRRK